MGFLLNQFGIALGERGEGGYRGGGGKGGKRRLFFCTGRRGWGWGEGGREDEGQRKSDESLRSPLVRSVGFQSGTEIDIGRGTGVNRYYGGR